MIAFRTPDAHDAATLAELGRSSFVDAFGHLYTPDDLGAFLESAYSTAALKADLANPDRLFRVAEEDGVMIGYCKLGLDLSLDYDPKGLRIMELKQLYLRGSRTGSGVGASFMDWALKEGRDRGFDAILLSVWSENHGAQRFYARYGFEKWGDTVFMVGKQADAEFLFGLRL